MTLILKAVGNRRSLPVGVDVRPISCEVTIDTFQFVEAKAHNEEWGGKGLGWFRKDQNEFNQVCVLHGFQEWGGKGFEAIQCAPQQQLLVVEVC